jgi:spore coat protein CotH
MIPKICFDKVFWICITACISFTVFVDQTIEPQITSVQAQVQKNTLSVGSISSMQSDVHDIKMQLQQQTQDIADIKAQLKTFH